MIGAPLDELSRVVGLRACALFERDGSCLTAHIGEEGYALDQSMLTRAFTHVGSAFDVFRVGQARVDEALLVAHGSLGALVVRNVQGGAVLCVVEPSVNMAVLIVALDVVAAKRDQALAARARPVAEQDESAVEEPVELGALVDRQIFRLVLNSLKRYVGPAAKVVLRAELAQQGLSVSAFPKTAYRPLMEALARRIPSPEKQGTFLAEVLHLAG